MSHVFICLLSCGLFLLQTISLLYRSLDSAPCSLLEVEYTNVPYLEAGRPGYCRSTRVPLLGSLTRYSANGLTLLSVPGEKAELKASWLSVK